MNFKQTSSGVTYIEEMTATVIISIACFGLLMGVVHARSELHSLQVKERATEELLNYMVLNQLIFLTLVAELRKKKYLLLLKLYFQIKMLKEF